jgi:hypothetical protein
MIKQYHAAAGDSASYLVKCSVCAPIAYVVLLNINYRTYAVVDPIGDSASGREEEANFFHKKFAHNATFL